MKVVLQRVKNSSVIINSQTVGQIQRGILLLASFGSRDTIKDNDKFLNELSQMRIFEGDEGHLSKTIDDTSFEILIVSQFTLHGSLKNQKWDFGNSAKPKFAKEIYNDLVSKLKDKYPNRVSTGNFGTFMNVLLDNDGPVTFIYDNEVQPTAGGFASAGGDE